MRPIASSETWYSFQVAGVCALQTYGRGIGGGLAPPQVGVGTPGGTETVAHALASALAEDPETVVISVDMSNAFHIFLRAAISEAVQQSAPALQPMVQWAYKQEKPLHIVGPGGHSSRHITAWSATVRPLGSAMVCAHAAACAGPG